MVSLGFKPATNKEGFSKIKFLGMEKKEGVSVKKDDDGNELYDPITGEIITFEWSLLSMNFDVMSVVRGEWQRISIATGENYSSNNLLGILLKNMGFESQSSLDEDGFEVENENNTDEDGFEVVGTEIIDEIRVFIDGCINKYFLAEMYRHESGKNKSFWKIKAESVKPYVAPVKQ